MLTLLAPACCCTECHRKSKSVTVSVCTAWNTFYFLQDWGSLLPYPFKSKLDSQFAVFHGHGLWTVSISITEELLDPIPVPLKQNLWGQNLGNKLSRWLSIKEASEYNAAELFCCTSSVSKMERAARKTGHLPGNRRVEG